MCEIRHAGPLFSQNLVRALYPSLHYPFLGHTLQPCPPVATMQGTVPPSTKRQLPIVSTRYRWSVLVVILLLLDLILHLRHMLQAPTTAVHARPSCANCGKTAQAAAHHTEFIELARRAAGKERWLIVAFVRAEQAQLAANFVAMLSSAGLEERLLGLALDDASDAMLRRSGVLSHIVQLGELTSSTGTAMNNTASLQHSGLGPSQRAFNEKGLLATDGAAQTAQLYAARWRYAAALTRSGLSVWLSDVRVLWMSNPFGRGVVPSAAWLSDLRAETTPSDPRSDSSCEVAMITGAPQGHALALPPEEDADAIGRRQEEVGSPKLPKQRIQSPSLSIGLSFHMALPNVWRWQLRMAGLLSTGRAEEALLAEELGGCPAGNAGMTFEQNRSACIHWYA